MNNLQELSNDIELKVYNALKNVYDPEIALNIIDLGLVYQIQYTEQSGIKVVMTLSTPGCPMGDAIIMDMDNAVKTIFPDIPFEVQLVWEPKWNIDFITPAGRKVLGMD